MPLRPEPARERPVRDPEGGRADWVRREQVGAWVRRRDLFVRTGERFFPEDEPPLPVGTWRCQGRRRHKLLRVLVAHDAWWVIVEGLNVPESRNREALAAYRETGQWADIPAWLRGASPGDMRLNLATRGSWDVDAEVTVGCGDRGRPHGSAVLTVADIIEDMWKRRPRVVAVG